MSNNSNVAIFWDIENVTPPSSNTLFTEGLWDYAEGMGRVISSYAYADWSKPGFRRLAPSLAALHFYMVHVPRERKTKNSADMQLVSDALDLLRFYNHIDTYILITGDSDFRPLLTTLRRAGKMVHIICDIKTAAQDLLAIADSFTDFREVLPGGDDDSDDTEDEGENGGRISKTDRKYWFEVLAETAAILEKERKSTNISSVKIKLKMLNQNFNEKALGFKRWSDFVTAAVKAGYVVMEEKNDQTFIHPGKKGDSEGGSLQSALRTLLQILKEFDGKSSSPQYHRFSVVNSRLKELNIDTKKLGFSKFKAFVQSAEARGLIESKAENTFHYMRRIP